MPVFLQATVYGDESVPCTQCERPISIGDRAYVVIKRERTFAFMSTAKGDGQEILCAGCATAQSGVEHHA